MNLTADLFEPQPAPLARRRDPLTSHKAAEKAQTLKAHHESAIAGAV